MRDNVRTAAVIWDKRLYRITIHVNELKFEQYIDPTLGTEVWQLVAMNGSSKTMRSKIGLVPASKANVELAMAKGMEMALEHYENKKTGPRENSN